MDLFSDALDFINDFVCDLCNSISISACELGQYGFDKMGKRALSILQLSPSEWNPEAWNFVVDSVLPTFYAVAGQLVVLFYLIGFMSNSLEPEKNIRLETIIKGLFKILLAQLLITNTAKLTQYFFAISTDLLGKWADLTIKSENGTEIEIELISKECQSLIPEIANITNCGVSIVTLICALVYTLCMLFVGGMLVFQVTMRFLKICMALPFGVLSLSTVAGNRELSASAVHYIKFTLLKMLEGVAIILAIILFLKIQNSVELIPVPESGEKMYNFRIVFSLINEAFTVLLLFGAVKGSTELLKSVGNL